MIISRTIHTNLFTNQLWKTIEPIYNRILNHPFLLELVQGSLEEDIFRFYVVQDSLYLKSFARGLALLGARSFEEQDLFIFCEQSQGALLAESSLHKGYFQTWGLTSDKVDSTPLSPTYLLYTSYLLRIAYERPYFEAIGAFLPCYLIYLQVGQKLKEQGSPHPLYQRWIQNYASESFSTSVQAVLEIINRMATLLTSLQQQAMEEHFVMSSKLEYLFWDMAYQKEQWKI